MAVRDVVQAVLYREIDRYRAKSFENYLSADVSVTHLPGAKIHQYGNPRLVGFDQYKFGGYDELEITMRVRYGQRGVRIWYHGSWTKVKAYLRNLPRREIFSGPFEATQQQRQCEGRRRQSDWWAMNGKTFALANLPPERRDLFYAFALNRKIEPYPYHKSRRLGQFAGLLRYRQPNMAIFKLNRQVYDEASKYFYLYNAFTFEHGPVFEKTMRHTPLSSRIRHIELALSHEEMLSMFGFAIHSDHRPVSRKTARVLRFAGSLDSLTIRVAPPKEHSLVPWLEGACQRKVVDMLFEAALPFVRGHHVKFAGFIKKDQKETFEAVCLAEEERYQHWMDSSTASGSDGVSMNDYDKWTAWVDEDGEGGVSLGGSKGLGPIEGHSEAHKEEKVRYTVASMHCTCDPVCNAETWSSDA